MVGQCSISPSYTHPHRIIATFLYTPATPILTDMLHEHLCALHSPPQKKLSLHHKRISFQDVLYQWLRTGVLVNYVRQLLIEFHDWNTRAAWPNCKLVKQAMEHLPLFWAAPNGHDPGRVFEAGLRAMPSGTSDSGDWRDRPTSGSREAGVMPPGVHSTDEAFKRGCDCAMLTPAQGPFKQGKMYCDIDNSLQTGTSECGEGCFPMPGGHNDRGICVAGSSAQEAHEAQERAQAGADAAKKAGSGSGGREWNGKSWV